MALSETSDEFAERFSSGLVTPIGEVQAPLARTSTAHSPITPEPGLRRAHAVSLRAPIQGARRQQIEEQLESLQVATEKIHTQLESLLVQLAQRDRENENLRHTVTQLEDKLQREETDVGDRSGVCTCSRQCVAW